MWELHHKKGWVLKNWCFWIVVLDNTAYTRPWTAKRSNQLILKELNPEYSLEGLMLKLKFQYFDHLMRRSNWLEKTLMLGKTEGRKRRDWQRMRWFDGTIDSMGMSLSKLREKAKDREAWHAAFHGVTKSWTWLSDWSTTLNVYNLMSLDICMHQWNYHQNHDNRHTYHLQKFPSVPFFFHKNIYIKSLPS